MKNVVLTGFMASGKSTIAREIASRTGFSLLDTDKMVEESERLSCEDIFRIHGEKYFRECEKKACAAAAGQKNVVIATGGGAVLNSENIEVLRKSGVIVNLDPGSELAVRRLVSARTARPLADGESEENIKRRYNERKSSYDNCDFRIDVSDELAPGEYAERIIELMR